MKKGFTLISKACKGFTLIEILVVISITGFLVVMGIASYNEFNRRQILDQAAKNVLNDLRFAQSKASMGNKGKEDASECVSSDTLVGWKFEILSDTQYRIYGVCGSKPIFGTKTVNLPSSLIISGSTILFKPLNLGIDQDITITITGYSNTKRINVLKAGTININ